MPKPKGKSIVLGLDLGSITTGWSVFVDGKLKDYGKMHPGKPGGDHGEKLHVFFVWLTGMLVRYKVTDLVVERPYPGPRKNVYAVLMMFFGAVHVAWYSYADYALPEKNQIGPRDVKFMLKLPRIKNYDLRKKQMVDWVNAQYHLNLKYKKADRRGSTTEADIADSIAVVHAWLARIP